MAVGVVLVRGCTGTGLEKPAPRTPCWYDIWTWAKYGLDRYGFGRRTGTICVLARVQTMDQYGIRTSTAVCAVPVRSRTGTSLEQHEWDACTSTTVPVRSPGPCWHDPELVRPWMADQYDSILVQPWMADQYDAWTSTDKDPVPYEDLDQQLSAPYQYDLGPVQARFHSLNLYWSGAVLVQHVRALVQ
ncbi:hypothetical protein E0Z10_g5794 [Xylaria hypoxylon]|uniref:Uncharacterized protein n=1 Tax=Xylaria hypoxylon TaxID=37992 RepID=A0A4Z0YUY0_9PEZI|nr:hypothetical protein E0Z10_g5794 [Xylaria hypoxylon]